jgi:hypothetical protein
VEQRTASPPHVPASTSVSDASNFEQDEDYEDQQLDDTPPAAGDQLQFAAFDSGISDDDEEDDGDI